MPVPINKNVRAFLANMLETIDAVDQLNGVEQAIAQAQEKLRTSISLESQAQKRADEYLEKAKSDARGVLDSAATERQSILNQAKEVSAREIAEAKAQAEAIVDEAKSKFSQADEAVATYNEYQKKIADQTEIINRNTSAIADQMRRLKAIQDNIAAIAASARIPDGV